MPMLNMQARHFEFMAAALRDTRPLPSRPEAEFTRWVEVVDTFALRLDRTHARFDRVRFEEACDR